MWVKAVRERTHISWHHFGVYFTLPPSADALLTFGPDPPSPCWRVSKSMDWLWFSHWVIHTVRCFLNKVGFLRYEYIWIYIYKHFNCTFYLQYLYKHYPTFYQLVISKVLYTERIKIIGKKKIKIYSLSKGLQSTQKYFYIHEQ